MPRLEEILGEMPQAPTGAARISAGSRVAGASRQKLESKKIEAVSRRPLRGCTCKNCKGSGCVFYGRS